MPLPTDSPFEELNFSRELRIWAKKNAVTPTILNKRTGWRYVYCSNLLGGKVRFGYHSFGLFVCAFGIDALEDIFRMAKFPSTGESNEK